MAKHTIVAIDDEIEFIDMLQNYFGLRGYEIDVAIRGARGIEIVKEKKPDVVLMDLKMPKTSGFEAACHLRYNDETSRIPVIAMSSYYYPDEHPWFKSFCSFKRWLTKPFNPSEAVDEIESVLAKEERSPGNEIQADEVENGK